MHGLFTIYISSAGQFVKWNSHDQFVADLLNNRSDPLKDPIPRERWKHKRRRRTKNRDVSGRRAELRDGDGRRHRKRRRNKERRHRQRPRNNPRLIPDVTTNQIDALLPEEWSTRMGILIYIMASFDTFLLNLRYHVNVSSKCDPR